LNKSLIFIILEKQKSLNMELKIVFLLTLSLFFCLTIFTQNKLLGKVTDFKQQPIADAQVFLNGQKVDVSTNERGYFEAEVPDSVDQISVYSPKYGVLTSSYSGESELSFVFLEPKKTEKEKISVGYGEVDKENLTYAIDKIDAEKKDDVKGYVNIYDYIRGRLPGVRVTSDNRIIIRGVNTLGLSYDPLFVVDGSIVNNIDFIDMNQIKDISVLKDASASIYGSRGANGVILINLKK